MTCTPHGLQLSMCSETAEWLLKVSEKPDDYEVLYTYLHRTILQKAHPFGELLFGLATLLRDLALKRGAGQKQLREVASAMNVAAKRLQTLMLEMMPPLGMTPAIVMEVIRTKLFEMVGTHMLDSCRDEHTREDKIWAKCISKLDSTLPAALGVPPQFWLPGEQLPYAPVIQHLQAVPCFPAPQHKLERFYDAAVAIAPCISRYHQRAGNAAAHSPQVDGSRSRIPSHQNLCAYMLHEEESLTGSEGGMRMSEGGARVAVRDEQSAYGDEGPYSQEQLAVGTEDLLPLMAYALIRAQLPAVVSELRFIELFLGDDPEVLLGPLGFCLATFQSAVQVVLSLDASAEKSPRRMPRTARAESSLVAVQVPEQPTSEEGSDASSDAGSTEAVCSMIASGSTAHLEAVASALAISAGTGAATSLKQAAERVSKPAEGGRLSRTGGVEQSRVPSVILGMVRLLQELAAHLESRPPDASKQIGHKATLPEWAGSKEEAAHLTRDLACLAVGPHARANLYLTFGQHDLARRRPTAQPKRLPAAAGDPVRIPHQRGHLGMTVVS